MTALDEDRNGEAWSKAASALSGPPKTTAPPTVIAATSALVIQCFNVKYSPNLGDGLLSECLESTLVEQGADRRTGSIDLAARKAYGETIIACASIMGALDALPKALRRTVLHAPLALKARQQWRPHYRTALEGADAAVIGGGNLLADLDLNFPTKLKLAVEEVGREDLPMAIYGCGLGEKWSRIRLRRCRDAFAYSNLRAVFVHDRSVAGTN